jgi:dihydroorotate dehydrogenase
MLHHTFSNRSTWTRSAILTCHIFQHLSAGTNYKVMKKAFDEGWGGVICKTLSLDSSQVNNVTPRYGRMKASDGQVIGWENIELISDRPFPTMLQELKQLKEEYPDRCASRFSRKM